MRETGKSALGALGVAVLFGIPLIYPLIDPHHELVYHLHDSSSHLFAPVLIDVLLLALILFFALHLVRVHTRAAALIYSVLLLLLPSIPYYEGSKLYWWSTSRSLVMFYLTASAVGLFWLCFQPRGSAVLANLFALSKAIFLFAGFSGVVVILQILYFWHAAHNVDNLTSLHARTGAALPRRAGRVIWIVLDELSQEQAYEHRCSGLQLPAFDAFASQATAFTQVTPAGLSTEEVMPSLMTGEPIDRIERSASGRLVATHDARTGGWKQFSPTRTIFQDALRSGYSTAIDGWYNPYCRTLAPVLDHCVWQFHLARVLPLRPDLSITQNALAPVRSLGSALGRLLWRSPKPNAERTSHIDDYLELRAAAQASLADPSQTFLLIHMPVPHPLAIYNRASGQLDSTYGSYLDNLKLADIYLGEVRQQLKRQGEWDSATVVLMGDHSWRVPQLWRNSEMWTPEDEIASQHGHFDPRPAYLVKLPQQFTAAHIDCPYSALRTRALLDRFLTASFHSTDDLQTWACSATTDAALMFMLQRPSSP